MPVKSSANDVFKEWQRTIKYAFSRVALKIPDAKLASFCAWRNRKGERIELC